MSEEKTPIYQLGELLARVEKQVKGMSRQQIEYCVNNLRFQHLVRFLATHAKEEDELPSIECKDEEI